MFTKQIMFLTNVGFNNVSLYEDLGKETYFNAATPSGKEAEVKITNNGSVAWRELGVYPEQWNEEAGKYAPLVIEEQIEFSI
ncbi:hypothetical protein ACPS01_26170 [Priestia aryabhattai]